MASNDSLQCHNVHKYGCCCTPPNVETNEDSATQSPEVSMRQARPNNRQKPYENQCLEVANTTSEEIPLWNVSEWALNSTLKLELRNKNTKA